MVGSTAHLQQYIAEWCYEYTATVGNERRPVCWTVISLTSVRGLFWQHTVGHHATTSLHPHTHLHTLVTLRGREGQVRIHVHAPCYCGHREALMVLSKLVERVTLTFCTSPSNTCTHTHIGTCIHMHTCIIAQIFIHVSPSAMQTPQGYV